MPPFTPQFFDPNAPLETHTANLPHWHQENTIYFVTFRTADSLPKEKLLRWHEELSLWKHQHPFPWSPETRTQYHEHFPLRLQHWLDQNHGECLLRQPRIKQLVEETIRLHHPAHYHLDEFIVMPNHVHALLSPNKTHTLSSILSSWKTYTARTINTLLHRHGSFWQKESYDHIVRTPTSLDYLRRYIRENPHK